MVRVPVACCFDFDAEAKSYEGEIEVELRDDLIARMTWLNYKQVD